MIGMSGERISMDLPLPDDEIAQQRNADCASEVAHEIADARDLIKLLSRYADIVQRADGDKDERDANHLDDAIDDKGYRS